MIYVKFTTLCLS